MSKELPRFRVRLGTAAARAAAAAKAAPAGKAAPADDAAARARTGAPGSSPAPGGGSPQNPNSAVPSGRVQFDDRGNAVWEWSIATGAFARDISSQRLKALEHPALALADDAPANNGRSNTWSAGVAPPAPGPNQRAAPLAPRVPVKGYNPYDSGKPTEAKKEASRKKDLRKLGEWLTLRKQAAKNKLGED